MSFFGEICAHGSLLRSCAICDLDSQIALLQAEVAESYRTIERLKAEIKMAYDEAARILETELALHQLDDFGIADKIRALKINI